MVQWYPTLPPPPGTVFAYYQVQYRTIGEEGEGLTETVDAGQSWVLIDQLENAHNYEVGPYNQPCQSCVAFSVDSTEGESSGAALSG